MLIGEVSKRSGLSKDGLRYYENLGLIHSSPVQAGSKMYRDYDDTTLERLAIISLAKRLGFSLKELTEPLDAIINDRVTREERSARLAEKLAELDAKIAELQQARVQLALIVDRPDKEYVDQVLKRLGLWLE